MTHLCTHRSPGGRGKGQVKGEEMGVMCANPSLNMLIVFLFLKGVMGRGCDLGDGVMRMCGSMCVCVDANYPICIYSIHRMHKKV